MGSFDDIREFVRIERERAQNLAKRREVGRNSWHRRSCVLGGCDFLPGDHPAREVQGATVSAGVGSMTRMQIEDAPPATEGSHPAQEPQSSAYGSTGPGLHPRTAGLSTNVPLDSGFVSKILQGADTQAVPETAEPAGATHAERAMAMDINKRLAQVSTEKAHLDRICGALSKYSGSRLFKRFFVEKILDQGRVQVSKHTKSYIAYSYLFCAFYSREMIEYFRIRLFTLNASPLCGIYLIYFGVLKLKQSVKEANAFIRAVVCEKCNESSGEVVEWFLVVLGDLLRTKLPQDLFSVCENIEQRVLVCIENRARIERISSRIRSLLGHSV